MLVREAAVRDLDPLVRIEEGSFDEERFSRKLLELMITEDDFETLVAVVDGAVVAYITAHAAERPDEVQILSLAVDREHRRKGIGRELIRHMEKKLGPDIRLIALEVRVSNAAAIRLYLSEGYMVKGIVPGYYSDGEDALYMEKPLP